MNQSELVAAVSVAAGQSKDATQRVIKSLGDVIHTALKSGDQVVLNGIGKLSVKAKPARSGRNPRTGAALEIAARNSPVFTAGKALKDAIN